MVLADYFQDLFNSEPPVEKLHFEARVKARFTVPKNSGNNRDDPVAQ